MKHFRVFFAQMIIRGTFLTEPVITIVPAEFVFVDTFSIRPMNIVWVTFFTMSRDGDQAVGKLTGIISKIITSRTRVTSSQEII